MVETTQRERLNGDRDTLFHSDFSFSPPESATYIFKVNISSFVITNLIDKKIHTLGRSTRSGNDLVGLLQCKCKKNSEASKKFLGVYVCNFL